MTGSPDRRDADDGGRFELMDGPDHVLAPDHRAIPGYYRAVFRGDDGDMTRFLTDMGYAEVIRRRGEGRTSFSADELDTWTVPPDLDALEARFDAEAGQGA